MLNAAGSLRWFRDAFAAGSSFDELTGEAAACDAGAGGATFLPYLQGERTPHADPDARGSFTGLSLHHDRGALVRAVLEGVAYGLRDTLELLRGLGVEPTAGRASGGGAHSRLWLEIVASALGLPLERSVVDEGSAYGAALLAGVAGGTFAGAHEAVAACVRVRETVEPNAAWASRYEDGYARYRALYPAIRGVEEQAWGLKARSRSSRARVAGSEPRSRRALSNQGVAVGLASRSGDDLGLPNALGLTCDVRNLGQVEDAVARTVERFGRLDICVANAGVGSYHTLVDTPVEHLEEMIDVNLKGTIYAARASIPHLIASGGGDLVTVASEAGRRGLPGEAVYCASKFGQVGLTRALDHELREHGVRCTNVCPGGVATDFALEEGYGRTPDVLDGMMSADDVAEVVLFCLTRPRAHRILETALRPMTEQSWG